MMKDDVSNLAIFGGSPLFADALHVGRPNIGDRQRLMKRFDELLNRRWLTNNGPLVQEFEQCLAAHLDVKHCVVMCNATVALEIAIRAAGLKGEVIIPSFTFIATAHALQWQGITPVFCDIDPQTHNIDPERVEGLITPRTTGIIGVHVWGRACAVEQLSEIAVRHRLILMFDAAHAFACSHAGRMIGNFGLAEVFSFHATKFFNTFEGGAVTTNDDELARIVRLMKNFGFTGYDQADYIGTNGKMSEMSAAMGLTGLESLDEFIAVNRRNYDAYQKGLAGLPGIKMVDYDDNVKNNYQYVVIEVDEHIAGLDRDLLILVLKSENVLARRYFYPGCHRMEPYRTLSPHAGLVLPHTESLSGRVLSFPSGTGATLEQVQDICKLMQFALFHGRKIRERLGCLPGSNES